MDPATRHAHFSRRLRANRPVKQRGIPSTPTPGSRYVHFKGGHYVVDEIVRGCGGFVVLYHRDGDEPRAERRERDEFLGVVERDGRSFPRFVRVAATGQASVDDTGAIDA